MRPASFPDANNGGVTDACHVLGFGRDLGSNLLPTLLGGLPCTLRHFLDGGTGSFFPDMARVAQFSILVVSKSPWKVLWHMDAVLGEGLFTCSRPLLLVYCPSHLFPWQWVWHELSILELLCLYQLPLAMDLALRGVSLVQLLPFKDSPPQDLFVSVSQQLWGVDRGVLLLQVRS